MISIHSREALALHDCLFAVQLAWMGGGRFLNNRLSDLLSINLDTIITIPFSMNTKELVDRIPLTLRHSDALMATDSPYRSITWSSPSIRTLLCIPVFLLASGTQYDCHNYLASLPKYTLPVHPTFQLLVCPHYTAECLIYLSLTVLAAPRGTLLNATLLTALIFVSVNLSISASTTKDWYARKFGKEKVMMRWKMIPFVY